MKRKGDFPAAVKRLIAQRAGYRCSIPMCGRLTIGPGLQPEQVTSVGVAAHIFAAVGHNGPRGDGGLTTEQLMSSGNGIWVCADHGRLIDDNAGNAYPADLLESWKALHEARTRAEVGGHPKPFGWRGVTGNATGDASSNDAG